MTREKRVLSVSGYVVIVLMLIVVPLTIYWLTLGEGKDSPNILAVVALMIEMLAIKGYMVVNPNEARVLQLFGSYVGSDRTAGLRWVNPFCTRRRVSLRIRNFESNKLKVNDHDGNPIEIAAVVVWKVVDSAEASFEVDNYENFVNVQSEAALRNLASTYSYDAHAEGQMSLRANVREVAEQLKVEIQERLQKAGVEVIESRISHLAYAPEIAQAMLRRQQASAVIAARQKIVEGAVGMVESALDQLAAKKVIELDQERRAAMVSNLLVVLCSEQHTQPVINTGTLYN
jgi:regulator of protease activity HflC (stomatin/prohibitin superfamily)